MAAMLKGRLVNITGDVLLASGVVAYLGAFDARSFFIPFRVLLSKTWSTFPLPSVQVPEDNDQ